MQEEFFPSVEDFVAFSGGDHAINKILIANNGIGAVKAIRSIRKWAYHTFGNERMVSGLVCMHDSLRRL
jgi:acetyl-CoA carboxylase / biotin carboxylase 1